MTQTTSRLFDEIARLMTDAAGAAQGVRKEVDTMMRAQAEKILRELDVVPREEFEAVRAMAQKAREENEVLAKRLAKLESGNPRAAAKSPKAAKSKPASSRPKSKTAPAAKKNTVQAGDK